MSSLEVPERICSDVMPSWVNVLYHCWLADTGAPFSVTISKEIRGGAAGNEVAAWLRQQSAAIANQDQRSISEVSATQSCQCTSIARQARQLCGSSSLAGQLRKSGCFAAFQFAQSLPFRACS